MTIRHVAIVAVADDIQCQAAQLTQGQGHLTRVVTILAVGHVQHPEHTVLDFPMLPQPVTALFRSRQRYLTAAIDHNEFLDFSPRRRLQRAAFAHHPTAHLNIRPTVVLGEVPGELRIRHPPVGAFFDTPVSLVVLHVVRCHIADLILQPVVDGLGDLAVVPLKRS